MSVSVTVKYKFRAKGHKNFDTGTCSVTAPAKTESAIIAAMKQQHPYMEEVILLEIK